MVAVRVAQLLGLHGPQQLRSQQLRIRSGRRADRLKCFPEIVGVLFVAAVAESTGLAFERVPLAARPRARHASAGRPVAEIEVHAAVGLHHRHAGDTPVRHHDRRDHDERAGHEAGRQLQRRSRAA